MSTITEDEIDERVADLTAHDFEPGCDGRPHIEDCDRPATWAVLLSCLDDRLWCDDHHREALRAVAEIGHVFCMTCHTDGVHIVHAEPLHGH